MSQNNTKNYTATIGIECHVQLKTKTKLFSAIEVSDYDAAPNTKISPICLGMPGALPVLNEQAVKLAVRAAYALNTSPQRFSQFERKHYFYPDLPKGYQISQLHNPIVIGGYVDIRINKTNKKVKVNRIQLEEDAGKTIHPAGAEYSLVDLNRAGTPLIEIVSEPDMHSPEEARTYAHELYLLMKYADVSDADLYHGNMRFDVNVSISDDPSKLGTRTETKNLNSFKSVEKAVEYEITRQAEVLQKGQNVIQETRGWDDAKQKTFSQRSKEEAHDYRYFPDPDIPPLDLDDEFIMDAKKDIKIMPNELRDQLEELGLDDSAIETLVEEMPAGIFVLDVLNKSTKPISKRVANWLTSDVQSLISDGKLTWEKAHLRIDEFVKLANLTLSNEISSTGAKQVLLEIVVNGGDPTKIAEDSKLLQNSDPELMADLVKRVIKDNPKAVDDLKNGEQKAMGFLIGQIMKLSKGQANPTMAQELIKKLI